MENNSKSEIQDVLPNPTLYVSNLNEKIKLEELRQSLFHLFAQYGDIIEINAKQTNKMRGQAFIVYKDLNSATTAKNFINGTNAFGKPIKVNYAKNYSDVILKLNGALTQKEKIRRDAERRKRRDQEYKNKVTSTKQTERKAIEDKYLTTKSVTVASYKESPNHILFVENLTPEISEGILKTIFSKYNGFKEVRLFQGKGVAFVEYDNEINAGAALLGLNNLLLTDNCILKITFAKK